MDELPLMEVKHVKKCYTIRKVMFGAGGAETVKAVDDVSFSIMESETLGVIGESGCGKTTLSRLIVGLERATEGEIFFRGAPVSTKMPNDRRKKIQMIYQNPYSAIDPRMNIRRILEEPLRIQYKNMPQTKRTETVVSLLNEAGFTSDALHRYPHEFSGGQVQRIGIIRSLVLEPELVVCDEPVSALDVSIQAQILQLLTRFQREKHLTYLFISHDMGVIHHVSDRIIVMYLGQIVEIAPKTELFRRPLHPYSRALMDVIPVPVPDSSLKRPALFGEARDAVQTLAGCPFQTRCPDSVPLCREERPVLDIVYPEHYVACHHTGKTKYGI